MYTPRKFWLVLAACSRLCDHSLFVQQHENAFGNTRSTLPQSTLPAEPFPTTGAVWKAWALARPGYHRHG